MTSEGHDDCVFCRIVRGDFGTPFIAESPGAVVFADNAPQAPTHLLIVPRRHIGSLADTTEADNDLLADLMSLARTVAHDAGLDDTGYRVLTNVGRDAGQSVQHLHLHVLGGRQLGIGFA